MKVTTDLSSSFAAVAGTNYMYQLSLTGTTYVKGNLASNFTSVADSNGISYTIQVTDAPYSTVGVDKGTKNWMKVTTDLSSSFAAVAGTNYMYQLSLTGTTYAKGNLASNLDRKSVV